MAQPQLGKQTKKAYVTLLSVLIISAVGVVVISSGLSVVTDNLIAASVLEKSKQAKALTDACAEQAINKLKINLAYAGSETINLAAGSCTISAIGGTGNTNRTIAVSGTVGTVVRKLNITITTVDPLTVINAWTES